jgi:hypothetical protein
VLSGLNFRALGIAWIIDIVGSTAIGIAALVASLVTNPIDVQALSDEAAMIDLFTRPEVLVPSFLAGSILSLIAGYVAARIAGTREIAHGIASSAAGIAVTLSSIRQLSDSLPPWLLYGGMVLGVVLGYAGGWLRLRTTHAASAAP